MILASVSYSDKVICFGYINTSYPALLLIWDVFILCCPTSIIMYPFFNWEFGVRATIDTILSTLCSLLSGIGDYIVSLLFYLSIFCMIDGTLEAICADRNPILVSPVVNISHVPLFSPISSNIIVPCSTVCSSSGLYPN